MTSSLSIAYCGNTTRVVLINQTMDYSPVAYIEANGDSQPDERYGLTPEEIKQCPLQYLIHETPLDAIGEILADGYLRPEYEVVGIKALRSWDTPPTTKFSTDQFPGVYTRGVGVNQSHTIKTGYFCTLVLSLALLRRRDWHANIFSNYGNITALTYDYATLHRYCATGTRVAEVPIEEIVFHSRIPLKDYCVAIIADEQTVTLLRRLTDIPVVTSMNNDSRALLNIANDELALSRGPNFCYDNNSGSDESYLLPNEARAILLNSGHSQQRVDRLMMKPHDELLAYLSKLWKSTLRKDIRYPVVVHPPY